VPDVKMEDKEELPAPEYNNQVWVRRKGTKPTTSLALSPNWRRRPRKRASWN
jgi:hypothetical protein